MAQREKDRTDPRGDQSNPDRRESIGPGPRRGGADRARAPRLNAVTDVHHRIQPAKPLPGVDAAELMKRAPAPEAARAERTIRGKALIFWDRSGRRPGKKLDAIDTDQITPAKDCVSEGLETVAERWQAGSARYRTPGLRGPGPAGAASGVAAQTFAVASSCHMSPAGLK